MLEKWKNNREEMLNIRKTKEFRKKSGKQTDYSYLYNLTETEKAYIAGIIDGEGNMSLSKMSNSEVSYRVNLYISNTNKELINWLHHKFRNGVIYTVKSVGNRKQCYKYNLCHNLGANIIKVVFPYLIVKREQAKLILDYWDNRFGRYDGEIFKDKIKYLNQRGINETNL